MLRSVTVVGLCVCVSVCHISPLERLLVLKILSRDQKICGDFSETASLQRYTTYSVVGSCSDILHNFSMAEPS